MADRSSGIASHGVEGRKFLETINSLVSLLSESHSRMIHGRLFIAFADNLFDGMGGNVIAGLFVVVKRNRIDYICIVDALSLIYIFRRSGN